MSCGKGFMRMRFDAENPAATAWAKDNAAKLVTGLLENSREAIRSAVMTAMGEGIPPRELAQLIRASIGLTDRDVAAVIKRQIELMQRGLSAQKASLQAQRYAQKLLRSRALMIARTETMRAANEGQQQLWNQAVQKNLLPADMKKVWLTSDPCPICAPLDGEEAPIRGEFSIGTNPPAHPRCRCSMGLSS